MDAPPRFALVTGATRGIGRHTALALADAGLDVAITGRTRVEGEGVAAPRLVGGDDVAVPGSLETTAREVEQRGRRCLQVELDLTSSASVAAAAEQVLATWGAPTLLVNNALVHVPHRRFLDHDAETLQATWTGNFLHQWQLTAGLLPAMLEAGGVRLVVGVVSASATHDPPGPPGEGGWGLAYSASKAAFGRIAGAINAEYLAVPGGAGLLGFNVDPGFVLTEAGALRGGREQVSDTGVPEADPAAVGRVVAWLLDAPDDERRRYLGRTIWAPALSERLRVGGLKTVASATSSTPMSATSSTPMGGVVS